MIKPPLQIRYIGNIYRLSAVCNEIKQKHMYKMVSSNSTENTTFNDFFHL